MKKRNTKKILTKLTAVLIVALMLVPMIPLTANAAALDETSFNALEDGTLLLKMSSLNANSVQSKYSDDITISNIFTSTSNTNAKLNSSDPTQILAGDTDTWGGLALKTNLPLSGNTAYTIEYYAKITDPSKGMGMFMGFCQNVNWPYYGANICVDASGKNVNSHCKWQTKVYYKKDTTTKDATVLTNNVWTYNADNDGFVRFLLKFDGQFMTVSIGGVDVVTYDFDRPTSTDKNQYPPSVDNWTVKNFVLQAGYTEKGGSGATPPKANDCILQIKDVSVYKGAVDIKPAYEDGDLLFKASAFDAKKITQTPLGITVANGGSRVASRSGTKILSTSTDTVAGVSVNTGLPFNSETAYTIDYTAKLTQNARDCNIGMFFGIVKNTSWIIQGANTWITANGKVVNTTSKYTANCYEKLNGSGKGNIDLAYSVWEDVADEEGFVKFTFTFDGRYMALTIDGTYIDSWDLTNPRTDKTNDVTALSTFPTTLYLAAGYSASNIGSAATSPAANTEMVEIKDIAIYSGVRTTVEVRDEDGKVLDKVETFDGEGISADKLAAVEGEQVIWCNRYTGAVVNAPSGTYTRDTVLVAKSRALNASDVLGVQLGDVGTDNKQDVRIVAGMYNTDGTGVGFDVEIKYMKEGVLTTEKHRLTSKSVFEAINANEDGDIKNYTANDLGANYLIAIAVEGIDTTAQVDFRVASFRTFEGSDARVYSEISEFSIVGGEVKTDVARLA